MIGVLTDSSFKKQLSLLLFLRSVRFWEAEVCRRVETRLSKDAGQTPQACSTVPLLAVIVRLCAFRSRLSLLTLLKITAANLH
jgi:hypothetical protein